MKDDPKTLVSTQWLATHLENPDLRVLDGSWYLPAAGRNARAEYDEAHIPGARFFDIDDVADDRSDLPHMAPSPEKFASRMRAMGIGDGHQVVVYDGAGLMSAARVWWLFRLMGQQDVAVLDGGFPKWRAEGRPVEDMTPLGRERHFTPRMQNHLLGDSKSVLRAVKTGSAEIVDARSPGRFRGEEPEPREGLRSGHMPGARNVPFTSLLGPDGTMKDLEGPEGLRATFESAGVDLSRPAITTCGSGVTAAVLSLALERLGKRDHALYDGSWAEWGGAPEFPVETGPA